jgi:hypothetical protein
MQSMRQWLFVLVCLACLVQPSCCGKSRSVYDQKHFVAQQDAGSVHVAVLSVVPWIDVVESMQPGFNLTGPDALREVIATSAFLESKQLDASAARAKLALPVSTTTADATTTTSTAPDAEGTSTATRTSSATTADSRRPGSVEGVTFGAAPQGALTAKDLPGKAITDAASPQIDATLKYQAATALYQEVQLLNRYVRDAIVREGFVPYAVRVQVTLFPRVRHEPYDAYANLAFFVGDRDGSAIPKRSDLESAYQVAGSSKQAEASYLKLLSKSAGNHAPVVVPLLVTDNLERAIAARSVDTIRQQAFALIALVHNFSGAAEFQRNAEKIDAILGHDYNSVMSLGRLTDNAVRVRLGAMNEATARYAVVPRTHDVSLLVLVPRESAGNEMRLLAQTVFVDTEQGNALAGRHLDEINTRLAQIVRDGYAIEATPGQFRFIGGGPTLSLDQVGQLYFKAQGNDRIAFMTTLGTFPLAEQLWVELLELSVGSQWQTLSFGLPQVPVQQLANTAGTSFDPSQPLPSPAPVPALVLLRDDGKGAADIVIAGASNLLASRISARLELRDKADQVLELTPTTVGVGSSLTLRVPSLRRAGYLSGDVGPVGPLPAPNGHVAALKVMHGETFRGAQSYLWVFDRFYNDVPVDTVGELPGKALTIEAPRSFVTRKADGTGQLEVILTAMEPEAKDIVVQERKVVMKLVNVVVAKAVLPAGVSPVDKTDPARGYLITVPSKGKATFDLSQIPQIPTNPALKPRIDAEEATKYRGKSEPSSAARGKALTHDPMVFDVNPVGVN